MIVLVLTNTRVWMEAEQKDLEGKGQAEGEYMAPLGVSQSFPDAQSFSSLH